MRVFGHIPFLAACVDAVQAEMNAKVADQVLESQSFVMYGKFDPARGDNAYYDFSSKKKSGDSHCILCYAAKQMVMPLEDYDKLNRGA